MLQEQSRVVSLSFQLSDLLVFLQDLLTSLIQFFGQSRKFLKTEKREKQID